jgi:hypothetical protein
MAERCANLAEEIRNYRQKQQEQGKPDREGATGPDHAIDATCGAAYTTDVLIQPGGAASPARRGGQLIGRRIASAKRSRGYAIQ